MSFVLLENMIASSKGLSEPLFKSKEREEKATVEGIGVCTVYAYTHTYLSK